MTDTPPPQDQDPVTFMRRAYDSTLADLLAEFRELKLETAEQTKAMKAIKNDLHTMREILTVWNDTKGFVKTIRIIGNILFWAAAVWAALKGINWARGG